MGSTSDLSWHHFEWVGGVKGIPGTTSDMALRRRGIFKLTWATGLLAC